MNKKLIAILTLVMFAITLLPMGAFAASKNTASGFLPTVVNIDNVGITNLASLRISEDDVVDNLVDGVFTIDLPTGVEFTATSVTGIINKAGTSTQSGTANFTATKSASRTMTVTLSNLDQLEAEEFVIPFNNLKITAIGTGDITATITDVSSGITSGSTVIGRFSSGSASVRAMSAPSKGETSKAKYGNIRITENTIGALAVGETVKIKLPKGMEWASTMPNLLNAPNYAITGNGVLTYLTGKATREIEYEVTTPSSSTGIYEIPTIIDIDDSEAKYGDIEVTLGGSADLDLSKVKIGAYLDFGYVVTVEETEEVLAGRADVEASDIRIKENIKATILRNRDIKITLPKGVYFESNPNVKMVKGDNIMPGVFQVKTNDRGVATATVSDLSNNATTFDIEDIKLNVSASFVGDIVAKISGSAGVTAEVTIATVKKPVSITSNGGTVKIGSQNQAIGDILIKETEAEGLISNKDLVITLPSGSTWSTVPTIEVIEGDIDLDKAAKDERKLTIPVKAESDVASTIKLSNVRISTDRTIAEGDMKFSIEVEKKDPAALATDGSTAAIEFASEYDNENVLLSVKIATVTTPAEDGVVQPVVMTVGSTIYTIDGVEFTMDVAPYIKDSRTYFPLRHVANAIGISNDNVVWDQNQRTVTIFRANRIVQITIGSKTMLVNGVPLTMDVAPEITADRTMLPIRFVAQGLGINVDWDDATRTVTLN